MKLKKTIYFRLFGISVFGALTLSLISLFCLIQISEMVVEDYRYGFMMFIGRKIEKSSEYRSVSKINVNKYTAPTVDTKDPISLLESNELTGSPLNPETNVYKPSLWLISNDGKIISSNTAQVLPISWEKLPHPKKSHDIKSLGESFFEPKTFVIKLQTEPVTYLVTHNSRSLLHGPFLWVQGLHTFATAALAVFLALSICFYYVRRKSSEARKVLTNLASGDLKARFETKRFDQFKNLVVDFNHMADEIERLVKRLNNTETSRSHLLQELGHDLRTPLTSLGISFEAVKFHYDHMTIDERTEIFSMIDSDIHYFKDLLDKLTVVATIDESHYKMTTENIDLSELLAAELKNRQSTPGNHLKWSLTFPDNLSHSILGDVHLISRLFKNAFDNAAKYAQENINVFISLRNEFLEIDIIDDGPGLTQEELAAFGKRRERRQIKSKDSRSFSLGLGSVIMKTIADVHDGKVIMSNAREGGACLKVVFKL